nr:rhamnan synthesis F family protein [uncultured Methanobrevibacter sp.]
MKRLGIFYCFDEDGIIDEYITYLLNDISQNLDELCIVYTGDLTDESIEKLKIYANDIIQSNKRYDAEAYGDVMINHYGWESLSKFDEIILFNDSFFGPFYPFKSIFDKMDGEKLDFWGITSNSELFKSGDVFKDEYELNYIQTYFLAFRKNLIISNEFQEYWSEFTDFENLNDLHVKHEAMFTKHFENSGFKWKVYVDSSDLEVSKKDLMNLYLFDSYNLIVNKQLPVLNKEAFKIPRDIHLKYNNASDLSRTIDYLKENTDYDVSLIYRHFLRILEPSQLVDIFNLVRIFPKKQYGDSYTTDKKILLIAHLYYDDIWEYAFNYFKNIPKYIDILISTNSDTKRNFFEEKIANNLDNTCKVIKIDPRGRDMAALFVASRDYLKEYDYFCFMHDKKSSGSGYITVGATFRDLLWENNLASTGYIENIIREFDENSSLGLIVPPRVYTGPYFYNFINQYWVANFDIVLDLLNQMGIDTPIDKSYPPLSIGNCFWAKYDALKPLFDLSLKYEDFPKEPMPPNGTISHALERIHGYVAASRGYCTEFVMTEEYARSEMFNINYMLHETFSIIKSNHKNINLHEFYRFKNTLNKLLNENNQILKKCNDIQKQKSNNLMGRLKNKIKL